MSFFSSHFWYWCISILLVKCSVFPWGQRGFYSTPAANQSPGFALNAVTSCTFVFPPFLQLTKPVSLIRPILSVLTTAQSMKWIVRVFIALCCLTRRAHNGFIKAEVSFGWQWVNSPCAVCWQQGIGYGRRRGFWGAFSFRGQPGSSECQPQVNKCVIDVGTAPVSPREAPSAFLRWDGHCGEGEVVVVCPPFTPSSHHRGQHRVKNEKGKRDKRYPRRRIRFNFGPFLLPAMFHFSLLV